MSPRDHAQSTSVTAPLKFSTLFHRLGEKRLPLRVHTVAVKSNAKVQLKKNMTCHPGVKFDRETAMLTCACTCLCIKFAELPLLAGGHVRVRSAGVPRLNPPTCSHF